MRRRLSAQDITTVEDAMYLLIERSPVAGALTTDVLRALRNPSELPNLKSYIETAVKAGLKDPSLRGGKFNDAELRLFEQARTITRVQLSRDQALRIRVSTDEKVKVQQDAVAAKKSLSNFIRSRLALPEID